MIGNGGYVVVIGGGSLYGDSVMGTHSRLLDAYGWLARRSVNDKDARPSGGTA
jgi:hypothetical protein